MYELLRAKRLPGIVRARVLPLLDPLTDTYTVEVEPLGYHNVPRNAEELCRALLLPLRALSVLHENGFVLRDICDSNFLCNEQVRVRLWAQVGFSSSCAHRICAMSQQGRGIMDTAILVEDYSCRGWGCRVWWARWDMQGLSWKVWRHSLPMRLLSHAMDEDWCSFI